MDREAFDDPVLGRVTPGEGQYEWAYTVPIGGREARGTIEIEDEPPVLCEPLLEMHRRFVTWLRGHSRGCGNTSRACYTQSGGTRGTTRTSTPPS
jgi:hypothetical protein